MVVLSLLSPLLISIAFALRAKGRGLGSKVLLVVLCTVGSFALLISYLLSKFWLQRAPKARQ